MSYYTQDSPPQQRLIQLKMTIVPKLRNPEVIYSLLSFVLHPYPPTVLIPTKNSWKGNAKSTYSWLLLFMYLVLVVSLPASHAVTYVIRSILYPPHLHCSTQVLITFLLILSKRPSNQPSKRQIFPMCTFDRFTCFPSNATKRSPTPLPARLLLHDRFL